MPTSPRRQPAPTRRTNASAQNPAAAERSKLINYVGAHQEALTVQAQRLEEAYRVIADLSKSAQRTAKAVKAAQTVINRQAAVIEGFGVRHETHERQIAHLASRSGEADEIIRIGRDGYQRVAAMYRQANPANPAQPVAEPAPEAPIVTEQEAMMPTARTDVTQMGASPLTDVAPDGLADVSQPYGEVANTPVGLNRTDVTAPVAGTQEANPPEQTIIPVDVRVGDPDNPEAGFPWTIGPVGAPQQHLQGTSVGNPYQGAQHTAARGEGTKRAFALMRLANLQISTGIAQGDQISVADALDASGIADAEVTSQIATLGRVAEQRTAPAPTQRVAAAAPRVRTVPSLAPASAAEGAARRPGRTAPSSISEDELGFA